MSFPWVWAELGVERTHEVGVIRRAYAARLKTTNPEDDGEAFQKLRAAYDHALAWARHAAHAPAPEAAANPRAALEVEALEAPSEPAVAASGAEAPVPPHVAKLWALHALLRPEVAPQQLIAAFRDVVDGPELDDIGVALEVERALADLIARRLPLADPLVQPMIVRFGWSETAQLRPGDEAKAFLLRRAAELDLERRMAKLRGLLEGGQADGDEVNQALADLLNSRGLDDLGAHTRVEGWLAQLILDHAPRADFLIQPAARRFQWRPQVGNPPVVAAVLQRAVASALARAPARRRPDLAQWLADLAARPVRILRYGFFAFMLLSVIVRGLSSHHDDDSSPRPLPTPTPVTVPNPDGPVWSKGWAILGCGVGPGGALTNCKVQTEAAAVPGFGKAALLEAPRLQISSALPPRELARLKVRVKVAFDPTHDRAPAITLMPSPPRAKMPAMPALDLSPSPPLATPKGWSDPVTPPPLTPVKGSKTSDDLLEPLPAPGPIMPSSEQGTAGPN